MATMAAAVVAKPPLMSSIGPRGPDGPYRSVGIHGQLPFVAKRRSGRSWGDRRKRMLLAGFGLPMLESVFSGRLLRGVSRCPTEMVVLIWDCRQKSGPPQCDHEISVA